MPLAKCPRCEKLFDKTNLAVCVNCSPAEEADYEKAKQCLSENPQMHADVIAEKTGVEIMCVLRMVDQGLLASSSSIGEVKCGRCGAPAISAAKKLCTKCLEDLNQQMAQQRKQLMVAPKKAAPGGDGVSVRQVLESHRES